MFGSIGGMEFVLIAVLALLLFGPRKLPQLGKSLGRALAEFRSATQEFKTNLAREVELEERRPALPEPTGIERRAAPVPAPAPAPEPDDPGATNP